MIRAGVLLAAALVLTSPAARAEGYPSRQITLIIPFAPGGSNDLVGRAIGKKLSEVWGQQVVVENRGGGGTLIGAGAGLVVAGSALYGVTVGLWQSPLQALFVAVKFPMLIFATVLGNAVLNGMLAQALGAPLTFRESFGTILMSFVIAALMLAAFAPVSLLLAWSAPATDCGYSVVLLTHVAAIAYAGVAANVRLWRWLWRRCGNRRLAGRVLAVWLAGNLVVGTQVSWIISPFIGSPGTPVIFIQEHPFQRNFFEYAVERTVHLLQPQPTQGVSHERSSR